jgi:hypothetical protein
MLQVTLVFISYDGQNWTEITKYSTESGGGALWVSPNGNIYIASDNGIVFLKEIIIMKNFTLKLN